MKKFFYKNKFVPKHTDNLMEGEGDLLKAREMFLKNKFKNLDFLLFKRFNWMNKYLSNKQKIIELGSGAGFLKMYLKKKIITSDAIKFPWIDMKINAMDINLKKNSVDIFIASHTIHHFYSPKKFLNNLQKVLKPGGLIIIQEINTSLIIRILLKMMKHEGWNYDLNIFDENEIMNNENDLWSANCAIPEMLFDNEKKFEKNFPFFEIIKNDLNECFIFPISGGVISKTKVIELPYFLLKMIDKIDNALIFLAPKIFACGRSVVLQKRK